MDGDLKVFDHYWKGAISGMSGIILSHPVDTIKTHIQNGTKIPKKFSALWKGIRAPLIGVGIEKALVFGTYNVCSEYIMNYGRRIYMGERDNIHSKQRPDLFTTALSGATAGFIASLIVTPYERIKILRQTGHNNINLSPRYLFQGLSMTFTREVPGFAIYFSVYETLKHNTLKYNMDDKLPLHLSFIYGGISGSVAWLFIYPQDRIKTIIQARHNSNKSGKHNIANIAKSLMAGGIRSLYHGFSFALLRAITLHSGTFAMMEFLTSL
jgi:solute carrier family 25 carnitine/acylcarnitine transporter 20/29